MSPAGKREFLRQLIYLVLFFVAIVFFKRMFDISVLWFLLGGILGLLLPYLDHFIYSYFINPHEVSSQRLVQMVKGRQIRNATSFALETREERRGLVFHSVLFQLIFLILTFFIVSSSGSVFGRGLALAFSLNLLVSMGVDIKNGTEEKWFSKVPVALDRNKRVLYWIIVLLLVLFFGIFF